MLVTWLVYKLESNGVRSVHLHTKSQTVMTARHTWLNKQKNHSKIYGLKYGKLSLWGYPHPPKRTLQICANIVGRPGRRWGVRTPGPPAQHRPCLRAMPWAQIVFKVGVKLKTPPSPFVTAQHLPMLQSLIKMEGVWGKYEFPSWVWGKAPVAKIFWWLYCMP